jgi:hypothetical protein
MILLENTKDTLTSVNKVIGYINKGKKYIFDNPTKELEKLYILRSQLNSILNQLDIASKNVNQSNRINKLTEDWLAVTQKINDYGIVSKFSVKVTDFADKYQHLMNKKNFTGLKNSTTISVATTVFSTGVNIADTVETYAKLNANTTAFSENLDILAYLSTNGNRDVSRNAANQMFDLVANDLDSYGSQLSTAIGEDVIMGGTKYAVSYLVNSNPYTKAIKAAYDAFDLLIGTSHKAQCIDTALYLESFTTAMCELINDELTETQFSYDCIRDNNEISDRYLTHLAQMRIVGEDNFVNYTKNTGLISQFFKNGYSEAKDWCDSQIQSVWQHSSNLKLTLSKNLSGYTSGN